VAYLKGFLFKIILLERNNRLSRGLLKHISEMYYSDKASLNEEYNFLQKTYNCDRLHKSWKKTRD